MQGENNKGVGEEAGNMQHLSKDQSQSLLSNFGHMTGDIFINEQKNTNKSKSSRYADTIKQFALSLHFYSPRAYKFVRRSLHHVHPPYELIKESINLLTYAGLDVHGVTFDGCAKNLATARQLECNLDKFDGSFNHPTRPNKTLYVILDVCHMLKLARNSLADMKFFFTDNGDTISWSTSQNYIMFKKVIFYILEISSKLNTLNGTTRK